MANTLFISPSLALIPTKQTNQIHNRSTNLIEFKSLLQEDEDPICCTLVSENRHSNMFCLRRQLRMLWDWIEQQTDFVIEYMSLRVSSDCTRCFCESMSFVLICIKIAITTFYKLQTIVNLIHFSIMSLAEGISQFDEGVSYFCLRTLHSPFVHHVVDIT
jgi:hypothetical protein